MYPLKTRPVHTSPIHSDLYLSLSVFLSIHLSLSLPFFSQASPAPIIVNTDTLESVPYVSFDLSFYLLHVHDIMHSRDIANHPLDEFTAHAE